MSDEPCTSPSEMAKINELANGDSYRHRVLLNLEVALVQLARLEERSKQSKEWQERSQAWQDGSDIWRRDHDLNEAESFAVVNGKIASLEKSMGIVSPVIAIYKEEKAENLGAKKLWASIRKIINVIALTVAGAYASYQGIVTLVEHWKP